MFFLAVLTWATLTTEPPKIVGIFVNDQPHGEALVASAMDKCLIEAAKRNKADLFGPPAQKFICLQAVGES